MLGLLAAIGAAISGRVAAISAAIPREIAAILGGTVAIV
jgi:hypothetical protein